MVFFSSPARLLVVARLCVRSRGHLVGWKRVRPVTTENDDGPNRVTRSYLNASLTFSAASFTLDFA